MAKKTAIVVHHTASHWADAAEIDRWHKQNGWSGIGYHYLISNGYPKYSDWQQGNRRSDWDGKVEVGRSPDTSVGAHCKDGGMNTAGIGVSLVGNFDVTQPTPKQISALTDLLAQLCKKHGIETDRIFYHRDFANKSCPGQKFLPRALLRAMVNEKLRPPVTPPKLFINDHIVEGAYLANGHWFAQRGNIARALGGHVSDGSKVAKVTDVLAELQYIVEKYNQRLSAHNRADIRAVRKEAVV